jgi:tetratricopeptide (TPR) repeat protein
MRYTKLRLGTIKMALLFAFALFLFESGVIYAQTDKKYIREGNHDYRSGKFSESELSYRRATETPKSTPDAWFNLGNAIYKQNRYDDAASTFQKNADLNDDEVKQSNSYYNLGNALINSKKIEESIEAYKKSLRLNPKSLEAKYNLAYAQDLLRKQEQEDQDKHQQQQNEKDQEKNKDNGDNQDKEKNQDKGQNQNKDKNQDQGSDNKEQNEEGQQQISMEDARRLLEALAADEQKIQEKVKKDKAAAGIIRTIKNW